MASPSSLAGLAAIAWWACWLAPYLRKFGQFTIADFLGARYGGHWVRGIAVLAAIFVSFIYVVAQIYGVGLITSRFTGVDFTVGVFLGLAGMLVCSFLGGMRAVTWTQVAQYIILIIAYLVPVVWLSVKQTGVPVPQAVYGTVLQQVTARERELNADPKEIEVRAIFMQRAAEYRQLLDGLPGTWERGRAEVLKKLAESRSANATQGEIRLAERAVADFPRSLDEARTRWTQARDTNLARGAPITPHAQPFPAATKEESDVKRLNFLALVLCMMVGTAALPHILMRFYTTPSVHEARTSVFWSLFFIFLLYVTAPALAVLVKFDVFHFVVGSKFADLPAWVAAWAKVDPSLMSVTDVNHDGIVQLAEISIGSDIVVLATPRNRGAAVCHLGHGGGGGLGGGLVDGPMACLLTIANALSHDVYYKMIDPTASTQRRVTISKFLLLGVALVAAYVTSLRPGNILFMVGAAFSLAASAFFPALVLGVFWKRANKYGAITGMLGGFVLCLYYMVRTYPQFVDWFGVVRMDRWFGIDPISAGVFGMPFGILLVVVVSLLTKAPDRATQEFVEHCRYPRLTRTPER